MKILLVNVALQKNDSFEIELRNQNNISNIKSLVELMTGIPSDQQICLIGGSTKKNDVVANDCFVTIQTSFKLLDQIRFSPLCKYKYDCGNLINSISDKDLAEDSCVGLQEVITEFLCKIDDKKFETLEVYKKAEEKSVTKTPLREFLTEKVFLFLNKLDWDGLQELLLLYGVGSEDEDIVKFCNQMQLFLSGNTIIQSEINQKLINAEQAIGAGLFDPRDRNHVQLYFNAKKQGKDKYISNIKLVDGNNLDIVLDTHFKSDKYKRTQYIVGDGHVTVLDIAYDPDKKKRSCVVMDSIDELTEVFEKILAKHQCRIYLCKSSLDLIPSRNQEILSPLLMQKDFSSCAYFSIHFATQAAKTPDLHMYCEQHFAFPLDSQNIKDQSVNKVPWNLLPPRFWKHSQSKAFLEKHNEIFVGEGKIPNHQGTITISDHFRAKALKSSVQTRVYEPGL